MELNQIFNEDCLDTMAKMPDGFIDLTVTSPPYNFDAGSGLGNKYNGQKDRMNMDEYFCWSVKIINELLRVSKLVCYNIQMVAGNKPALLKLIGHYAYQIKEIIIWDKRSAEPAINEKVLNSEFEFIFILSGPGGGRKIEEANFERGTASNIFRIGKNKSDSDTHLACFPHQLPDRLINYFSKEGETIYDPFLGLGTTAISAIKYKRNFIGSEINVGFYQKAQVKITAAISQTSLF